LGQSSTDTTVWNINGPITMEEIHKAVRSMQCNKAPGDPGDLGIDTLNALDDGNYSDCAKCLLILFNKI